jgi:mono/diheme cytochrome c family protein
LYTVRRIHAWSRESNQNILAPRSLKVNFRLKVAATLFVAATLATPTFAQNAGADTYKANCLMCHGPDGSGNTPVGTALKAANFKDPTIVKAPDAQLTAAVKAGKGKMPAFGTRLTDDQVKAVIAYVRTLEK